MSRELLKQALDALKKYDAPSTDITGRSCRRPIDDRLCNDIMKALAQNEAEPVAWMDDFGNTFPIGANKGSGHWLDDHKRTWVPLYATPQAIDGFGGNLDSAFAPAPAVPRPDEFVCPYCFDQGAAPAPSNQLSGNSGTLSDDDEELLNAALMHVLSGKSEQPAPAPVVPADMVMVPREPTMAMRLAAREVYEQPHEWALRTYRAMIAAAPAVQPCTSKPVDSQNAPDLTHKPTVQRLTNEQLLDIALRYWGYGYVPTAHRAFARAIERAHGIGGGGK